MGHVLDYSITTLVSVQRDTMDSSAKVGFFTSSQRIFIFWFFFPSMIDPETMKHRPNESDTVATWSRALSCTSGNLLMPQPVRTSCQNKPNCFLSRSNGYKNDRCQAEGILFEWGWSQLSERVWTSMKKFDILPEKRITVMEIHARTTDPASSPLTAFSVVAFWDSAEENVKVIKRDVKLFWSRKA